MALAACLLLTLALGVYIFLPPRHLVRQRRKTRAEYLAEREAVIAENLRDLEFEHRAGKYGEEDFARERAALAEESAAIDGEMKRLERSH